MYTLNEGTIVILWTRNQRDERKDSNITAMKGPGNGRLVRNGTGNGVYYYTQTVHDEAYQAPSIFVRKKKRT
jgi:hypothetical protein